jgi:hypothetical protein
MKTVKTYSLKLDADLAKLRLDAAGLPSVVVGVDVTMQGGAGGVQLLVPDEDVEEALKLLDES